jgi:hypothetical protein
VFDSIEFRYTPLDDGYRLTYRVQEFGELYRFRAEGFDAPAEEIFELLKQNVPLFGEKVPPTGTMVDRIGSTLQQFWKAKGNDSGVLGRLVAVGDDEFEMLFQPETAIETIAFVQFENSGVISPLDLQRIFNQAAMGVPYSEERLKELLHFNVRPLYEDKGRMEVAFCPCQTESDPDTNGLLVTVHVEQGEEYNFGAFHYPEGSLLQPAQIDSLLKVKQGEIANMAKVREGMVAIEDTLKRNGYMRAQASYDQTLDTGQKTVDVEVLIEPGNLYTMGNLTITGLDIVTEPSVRKRWGVQPGEPFDGGYPAFFLDRVREMFDNLTKTDSKIQVNEQNQTVNVELIFVGTAAEEKKPEF